MQEPVATLSDQATMNDVMETFDSTHAQWLPVLDQEKRLKGYISRQRLYMQYRKMVADMSED
jgi:CIC family chloride channel protein